MEEYKKDIRQQYDKHRDEKSRRDERPEDSIPNLPENQQVQKPLRF